jgi:hypothetical protein
MALFRKAEVTSAFLKMGVMGFAGSGKTYTATQTAIGLVQHMREKKIAYANKPIFFIDSETGSDWIKPFIEEAGIELFTAKTRAFKDLTAAVREAEANASILLVDSVTAFWKELGDSYMKAKGRQRLQFEDWGWLKKEWGRFTDLFVNSNLHIILCGRAGYEYDYFEDEETGKKNLEKTGIKMKAEGEMGYEPSLLVLMSRHMDVASNKVWRTASILKDRSTKIDGKEFVNPSFKSFLPHIEFLNLGGHQLGVDTSRTSENDIPPDAPRDRNSIRREICLEEIQALMVKHHPTMSGEDKKEKAKLLVEFFDTTSWTEVEKLMPLVDLQKNYDAMHWKLEKAASRYGIKQVTVEPIDDEIPHMEPAAQSLPAPPEAKPDLAISAEAKPAEPSDLDTIILDFGNAIDRAPDATERKRLWDETAEARAVMDAARIEKMRLIYGKALMSKNGKAPPRNTKRPAPQVEAAE